MRVEVVLALPRRYRSVVLDLPATATVADAVVASGLPLDGVDGLALHGQRVTEHARLHEGDRVELLRPLQMDPKEARRRRAARKAR